jgi:hypothetical protein
MLQAPSSRATPTQAADIYLLPYRDRITSNSGTLAMAMAAGKAIVTTPFEHARFALAAGKAAFIDFDNSGSIERVLSVLLSNREGMAQLGAAAKEGMEQVAWPEVGKQYAQLLQQLRMQRLAANASVLAEALGEEGFLASRNATAAFFTGSGHSPVGLDGHATSVNELKGLAKLAGILKTNHLNKVLHASLGAAVTATSTDVEGQSHGKDTVRDASKVRLARAEYVDEKDQAEEDAVTKEKGSSAMHSTMVSQLLKKKGLAMGQRSLLAADGAAAGAAAGAAGGSASGGGSGGSLEVGRDGGGGAAGWRRQLLQEQEQQQEQEQELQQQQEQQPGQLADASEDPNLVLAESEIAVSLKLRAELWREEQQRLEQASRTGQQQQQQRWQQQRL